MYKKDIERILMGVKVDDDHIMLGEPIEIEKLGRKMKIGQINWFYKWEKFSLHMGMFLSYFMNVCENFKMPKNEEDIKAFRDAFRMLISNKIYGYRAFGQLVKMCRIFGHDVGWMKRNFTIDDWAEVFLWIYIYNVFGVKKNLKNALRVIGKVQSN